MSNEITIIAESICEIHELRVPANTDFDSEFVGTCVDTGARIRVQGWNVNIEVVDQIHPVATD